MAILDFNLRISRNKYDTLTGFIKVSCNNSMNTVKCCFIRFTHTIHEDESTNYSIITSEPSFVTKCNQLRIKTLYNHPEVHTN